MKKLSFLLSVVFIIGFPAVTPAFEGVIVQKSTHTASDANPGMEAMEKVLQQMSPQQRKMMEERMRKSLGPRSSEPTSAQKNTSRNISLKLLQENLFQQVHLQSLNMEATLLKWIQLL